MTNNLTNQQKKDWAKLLFMQEGMTFQDIAQKVGVSRITVGRWAEKENWEMLRAAVTSTREEQIRHLYMQIAQITRLSVNRTPNMPHLPRQTQSTNCLPPSPKWRAISALQTLSE